MEEIYCFAGNPLDRASERRRDTAWIRSLLAARTRAPLRPAGEAAILAEARSLVDWHARHRFCAQCGSPTRVVAAGWVRRCPECKASHYPRSDPVTIMLAVRGERALLG